MPRRKSISQNRSDGFFCTKSAEKKGTYKSDEKKESSGEWI
jgi:hypothetical protein